jgi:hypothetical protein
MMFLWLLGLAAIGTAAGYWAWQRRRSDDPPPTFAFRCPRCGQKLRYAAASQGHKILCPQCLRCCTLPHVAAPKSSHALASKNVEG